MLEFQDGFFEQEIREGFYIDATMKTVWAAELEVLQKVAEICDRHDITWYAAYGTLLGAIRHEGFVPWDDDMDIWVKREDYNRLLQILPGELPGGYHVWSSLSREGYDQFHTCISSGTCISMEKEWLEQYHGCPFTVGLDIFPLDYVPREEKDRILQEKLVGIAVRAAQAASDMENKEYQKAEKPDEEKNSLLEEIWEGIRYLEENCGAKINRLPAERESWAEAASELQKWANYIAMMYGEEECDYLVNYNDYVRWPEKKFPKEWFAEVYSATFENFMLPVPCGYEQLLSCIYGNYKRIVRKAGNHEYPYYARQMRELRRRVREQQMQAEQCGLPAVDSALRWDEDEPLLPAWDALMNRADGGRKKAVLFANDIEVYTSYQEKALDKLEKILGTFEEARNQITLWWRPQRVMPERLGAISAGLACRYQEILDRYKAAGWGICDETDNMDRAVKKCDAYYGDINAILQPFQNAGKPIMIAQIGI